MSILVLVEFSDGLPKKSAFEALSYASAMKASVNESEVIALVLGKYDTYTLSELGKYGADKVSYYENESYNEPVIEAYASAVAAACEKAGANYILLSKSSLADAIASKVALKTSAVVAANVADLPDTSNGFAVKTSIFTGKAFAHIKMEGDKKLLVLKKNAHEVKVESEKSATVENLQLDENSDHFRYKAYETKKAEGDILLPEAEVVVSAGRGLKGPENWAMIEDLAKALGAATACSKPVSDMEWRPHHEHVGQTGIKIAPNLYIAVGISGAIQHLAGVNASKVIVVINKDADAPFFKAADYGIVGDAFEVIPKLTEAIKAAS